MKNSTASSSHLPWYHYRWPWVLMTIPFAAVLFGILMVSTALIYPDDVVVDTYYKDGQGINQLQALDEMALTLGINASLELSNTSQAQEIHITGTEEPYLTLAIFHVTDSKQDRRIRFTPTSETVFVSEDDFFTTMSTQRGVWYLELRGADNDWRLRRRIETPLERLDF
ncbi:MAG: FixH family protein [Gammaproteobacteria bacterium]